jgi:hypothetical protein
MSTSTTTASVSAAVVSTMESSSYRVKFKRAEFLELLQLAQPKIVYYRGNNFFLAFDGFVIYSQQYDEEDFANHRIVEAIELSNSPWTT